MTFNSRMADNIKFYKHRLKYYGNQVSIAIGNGDIKRVIESMQMACSYKIFLRMDYYYLEMSRKKQKIS